MAKLRNLHSRQNHQKITPTYESIPHELILDILSRLPAKTLATFRCVSKLWCNSIVNPNFIQMHINQAIRRDCTNIFLVRNKCNTSVILTYVLAGGSFDSCKQIINPFSDTDGFGNFRVLGSCNGLVCLSGMNVVCLLNPCTREYKMIHFSKQFTDSYRVSYGFGYDRRKMEYILVEFTEQHDDVSEVSVYSLTDASVIITSTIPYHFWFGNASGVYFNGYLHWVVTKGSKKTPVIVSFDKVFSELVTPPIDMCHLEDIKKISLGVLRGQLYIFGSVFDGSMELWVMQNYGLSDSLVKFLSVDSMFFPSYSPSILCFSENGKLLLKCGRDLMLYDPIQVKMWKIRYSGVCQKSVHNWIPHVVSLVQLKSSTYAGTVAGTMHSTKKKIRFHGTQRRGRG